MEAKELNIGDWVRTSRPFGSTDVDTFKVRYLAQNCGIENGEMQTFREYEEIMPIPLTEEILKANGYRLVKDQESNYCGGIIKNDELTIWVHLGDRYNYHTRIVNHKLLVTEEVRIDLAIRYVHELQHALRLCGLNELADNFKLS